MNNLEKIESKFYKNDIPDFKAGDKVKVNIKIKEENKERIQTFQGVVISRQNSGINETFTVRKISFSIGVERTFLIHSPMVQSIEKVNTGIIRRAKLYYLRDKIGKKARLKTVERS